MATARFPVVSVARAPHLPVATEPDSSAGSWAEIPYPRELEFTWRFMSADNRSLARSLIAGTPDRVGMVVNLNNKRAQGWTRPSSERRASLV